MVLQKLYMNGMVGLWGIGYLGYTTLIRLQYRGLLAKVWGPNPQQLQDLREGRYPTKEFMEAWSNLGYLPSIHPHHFEIAQDPEKMFSPNIATHIIAHPNINLAEGGKKVWPRIAGFFKKHNSFESDVLVILTSAGTPGDVNEFICGLGNAKKHVHVATAFRTDWFAEKFLQEDPFQIVGSEKKDAAMVLAFLERLGIIGRRVGSTQTAEIFHAFDASLKYVVSTFLNQFSFAYSDFDLREIAKFWFENHDFGGIKPSLGIGGRQTLAGIEAAFDGSSHGDALSILKEANSFNFSIPLHYAEFFKRMGVKKAGILGITPGADNPCDLALSPSLIFGEALQKKGIQVFLHDPNFSGSDLLSLLPNSELLDLDNLKEKNGFSQKDALVLMTPHHLYREFTQREIDQKFNGKIGILIDNTGIWKDFHFSGNIKFRVVGSGFLDLFSPQS